MNRREAILTISKNEVMKLEREERESIVLDWWGIDNENPIFEKLPSELQQEIGNEEEPTANIMDKKYDALLIEAVARRFVGVGVSVVMEQKTGMRIPIYPRGDLVM